ncbi:ThiF family adenylyltransferase [Methylomagnum ishizawai]|uniref:ThiF family adenylyltransferase n=1 Tax=Methylomagnum ishizawai TaxID=1760988 RepID=UPI001C31F079|nr:ThiF family adenylyltransferase [Methylomagnum ishizawai]BBL77507.1 thiamine biosynthesis protein ThiF [Methylomagnum ishizawai]
MTCIDLTFQENHLQTLRGLVLREDGVEAAAYILCGESRIESDPWERRARRRLSSYEVVPIPPEDAVSASDRHITWNTASFVRLLKRAKEEGLVAGIVHAHPGGPPRFSDQDDRNERELVRLALNRNGDGASLVSVLLTGAGEVRARLWPDLHAPLDAESIRAIGQKLAFYDPALPMRGDDVFARQALAFGPELNARLKGMRIGIVGCGGTGSATALLLARLGAGQLVLFDDDIVETTNLNRLHGARRADADSMRPKVDVVAREIAEMGIGTRVVPMRGWIGNPAFRDALKSCDVIFGCTDDHDGRLLLNRMAYFYLIPVLDMGLAIEPQPGGEGMRELSGRVTVLTPGAPCLLCRHIVDPVAARDEDLKRHNPEEHERRKREAYVRGAGNPAPAVVTFTTATACLAVDELIQGLTGFRGPEGWVWQRTRRFDLMQDRRPGAIQEPCCPICSETGYWGRADVQPFLDRAG